MGAVLGCCGGPSTDYDAAFLKQSSARYHPLLGRCDAVEKSLLGQLQRSLSTSWSARRLVARSPLTRSHTGGSRYGLDARYESASDSDDDDALDDLDTAAAPRSGGRAGSVASATSGSRLLCDFYNLVLECDHSKFFVDAHGRRVKGAYLSEVEILDDYFDAARRLTVGTRRRRRSSVDVAPYQPPLAKLKHFGSSALSAYDRSSNMSLMSTDTDETAVSESDYWATFLDKPEEPIEFVAEMTFPPKYGHAAALPYYAPPPPLQSYGRARRDSGDRRRSWQQDHAQPSFGSSLDAAASSLLLFSPVNATSLHEQAAAPPPPPTLARQRSSSRSSMRSGPYDRPHALPMEGSRYNLWDAASTDDEASGASKTGKAAVLPAAFSNTAVSERRRASLTMGAGNTTSGNGSRRMSLHAIAPIAV